MFRSHTLTACILALLVTGSASATTVTLDEGFESFNTGSVAGQDGWGIFSPSFPETITTAHAHDSTKSLYTGMPAPYNQPRSAGATKALDPASQGEYPNSSVTFPISYGSSWWAQAWVRVESGGVGAVMTVLGIVGQELKISGSGIVSVSPGSDPPTLLPNQGDGSNRLDEWLFIRIAHDPSMGASSELLEVTVLGPGTNLSFRTQYFSSSPYARYLVLAGDAYWDDIMVGTGIAPAIVPVPAAGWLFATAFGALMGLRRRGGSRA
jgi:hypothetical protein